MKAPQRNLSKRESADTQVPGGSMDSPFSNFAFAQQKGSQKFESIIGASLGAILPAWTAAKQDVIQALACK